jgi:hypothetical protein
MKKQKGRLEVLLGTGTSKSRKREIEKRNRKEGEERGKSVI